jgi:hypothetical protein
MKKVLLLMFVLFSVNSRATICDYALEFSGFDCFVTCGNSTSLGINSALTVEAWIFSTDSISNQKIAGNIDPFSNSGFELGVDSGKLYCEVKDINGNIFSFKQGAVSPNSWTHVAFTYSAGDAFRGYVNGRQVYFQQPAGDLIGNSSYDFIIGAAPWDQSYFNFIGKIDEVRVYNQEISITEIGRDMRMDVSLNGNSALVGYWRFREGTGTSSANLSGSITNNAILSGNVLPAWIDGDGPYGEGTAERQIILCCAPVDFINQNISIDPVTLSAPEEFVISYIMCDPGGTQPTGSSSYNYGYWVIDRYINATSYSADLIFRLDPNQLNTFDFPSDFTLYNRPANSTGDWDSICTGASINMVTGELTFSSRTETGQFSIGANGNTLLSEKDIEKTGFSVYPNPASDKLHVAFKNSSVHVVEIKDLRGRVVHSGTIYSSEFSFDVSAIDPGYYFITTDQHNSVPFIISR